MNDGAKYGRQQYLDYVARKHPTGGGAMGLAHSLLGLPASKYFEDRKKYFKGRV